MTLYTLS